MTAYGNIAAFYDLMAGEARTRASGALVARLGHLPPGVVIDVGAGTGIATSALAEAYPGHDILAVEPDAAMRIALLSRLSAAGDGWRRVSVDPRPIADIALSDPVAGVLLAASLVHFAPPARQALWSMLDGRLAPGGCAVIELQAMEAVDVPSSRFGLRDQGKVRYEGWMRAQVESPDTMRWTIRYLACEGGAILEEAEASFTCWVCAPATALSELANFEQLRARVDGDVLTVWR